MTKIPVGQTIAHAYGFAFRQFLPLLKLTWFPLLAVMVCNIMVVPQLMALSQGLRTRDFSDVTMPWPVILLLYAGVIAASFVWITAIYQYALGQDVPGHRWFYFSLARPMWRILGGFLLMILVLLALLITYILAIVALLFLFRLGLGAANISGDAMKRIATFDTAIAFVIGYCGFIFCAMRFGFLLFPATIAEDRIALTRSWTLSHGNFWRMFWIALALLLPFAILELAAFYGLGAFPHIPPGSTPAEIQAMQGAASASMAAQMRHYWYIVYPAGTIFGFLAYGFLAGAQSFAYRMLTGGELTPNPPSGIARSPAPPEPRYQP